MFDLLVLCPARGAYAPEAAAGPSWGTRLVRAVAAEYRARRAMRELHGLDEQMLRDIGLDRGGIEYVARFGRD